MKVFVLGGDGFCGWPTALHLSRVGHEVTIVDNFSRRAIDEELGAQSLTPITRLSERVTVWNAINPVPIEIAECDLALDYDGFKELLSHSRPEAVVHFAEQRSAPYSMKSATSKRYTVDNNIRATHNLMVAIVELGLDVHVVHLGTMGVYGYGWADATPIPEGYLTVTVSTPDGPVEREILHPANAGSVYHMTKTLDQLIFAFYAKNDSLRITDLHQGIVWGTQTPETQLDERLINRFDYDGDYGTVLNRFLMQASMKYPLTVHGTGGQTRAFIHIRDTVRCIEIALNNPPALGDKPSVFNQVTESHRVRDLAKLVAHLTGAEIDYVPNPRAEADENELVVENDRFLSLGLSPTRLQDGLLAEVTEIANRYLDRVDPSKIPARSLWREDRSAGVGKGEQLFVKG